MVFSIPSHVMTNEWFRGTPYDFGTSPCEILDLYGSKLPWYPDEHQCSSSNSYAPWSNGAWGFHGFWSSQKWNWKSLCWLYLAMIIPCLTIPMDVSSDSWPRRPICCRFHPNHLPARAMLRASPKSKPSPPGFSFSASCQVPWRFLQLFVSLLGSRDREFIQRIEEWVN